MLIKKTVSEIKESRDVPGLLECKWKHQIKTTEADLKYTGPRIDADTWNQVLSFFRWTQKEYHSESQARLFVNRAEAKWAAWAFPQEARTGMTAKEIEDCPATKEQRAQFDHNWIYFGTVHHHCSGSAFQSSTDEANEHDQDGLHITVGKMGSPHHDLHCRFYLRKMYFEPDMSLFWDIGKELQEKLPDDLHDRIARHQMGMVIEVPFPDTWKENIIEVVKPQSSFSTGLMVGNGGGVADLRPHGFHKGWTQGHGPKDYTTRLENAVETVFKDAEQANMMDAGEFEIAIEALENDTLIGIILDAAKDSDIQVGSLVWKLKELVPKLAEMELTKELQLEDKADEVDDQKLLEDKNSAESIKRASEAAMREVYGEFYGQQ